MKTAYERFEEKFTPEALTGCWLWSGGVNKDGYGNFSVGKKIFNSHRFSYQIYVGQIPDGMCVLHRCDTPCCVNPSHLFIGDKKTNTQDMIKKSRRGNCNKKLSISDVEKIKNDNRSYLLISNDYMVSQSAIHCIKTGKTWRRT